jgi:hypothetical protein
MPGLMFLIHMFTALRVSAISTEVHLLHLQGQHTGGDQTSADNGEAVHASTARGASVSCDMGSGGARAVVGCNRCG